MEAGDCPSDEGKNATTCDSPLTLTVAYRWLESPLRCLIRIVDVVASELSMPPNSMVPSSAPPRYPTTSPAEHPAQETTSAPFEKVANSASGELSLGPADQFPDVSRTQLTWFFFFHHGQTLLMGVNKRSTHEACSGTGDS